jgi:hypothetical protein
MAQRKRPTKTSLVKSVPGSTAPTNEFDEVVALIEAVRSSAVVAVNHELVSLY